MSAQPPPPIPPVGYSTQGIAPAPQQGNGPAVAGLVLGILGCVPWVTGALAIVLSIVGLRKTRDPRVGGKGVAIAGLILGILSVVGWSAFGGGVWALLAGTKEVRETAKQFVQDVGQHKITEATALCSNITLAEVQTLVDLVNPLGTFTDSTVTSVSANYLNGQKTADISGRADFSGGWTIFHMKLLKVSDKWKVIGVQFDAPHTGQ
jgi:hypothetical protein